MTPDDKEKYIDEIKNRAHESVGRADKLLSELAVKSAKLRTGVKTVRNSLTEQLANRTD
ncbi:hypothetical protein [Spirosoma sp.]|uniref:hypothetical protein n=1 Tax=Spirosoma sp. TaxID=1899569 RepID=UPI003B3A17BE